ncbi:MAG: hypothetical protein MHM6MM_001466 [Cercozoa sp. M6MM]
MSQSLTVLSYNVLSASSGRAIEALVQLADSLGADIVCLNEVCASGGTSFGSSKTDDDVYFSKCRFGKRLRDSPFEARFASADFASFGNVMLFRRDRLELQELQRVAMEPPEGHPLYGTCNRRSGIRGDFVLKETGLEFSVVCTHLDHISDDVRLWQLAQLDDELLRPLRETCRPHLLCGDLNSIHKSDFSDAEWCALVGHHHRRGWQMPDNRVMTQVREVMGMRDAFLDANGGDVSRLAPKEKCTAHVAHPRYRIDYVLSHGDVWTLSETRVLTKSSEVEATRDLLLSVGSDHWPLLARYTVGV